MINGQFQLMSYEWNHEKMLNMNADSSPNPIHFFHKEIPRYTVKWVLVQNEMTHSWCLVSLSPGITEWTVEGNISYLVVTLNLFDLHRKMISIKKNRSCSIALK